MYFPLGRKCLPPHERKNNFREVEFGLILEEAIAEANRCLQCKEPRCVKGCPAAVNIPAFIRFIRENKLDEARTIIKQRNPLPAICGRVCPQEKQCEKACVLSALGKPIHIGMLERYVGDKEPEHSYEIIKNGKKVAIVGSGPAGIVAANLLAKRGFEVELFEANEEFGGILRYGIPEFRLPRSVLDKELNKLKKLGIKLNASVKVGEKIKISELRKNFDAIFIAVGASLPKKLEIPGIELKGVLYAIDFLKDFHSMKKSSSKKIHESLKVGKNVVIIGGGNTAVDVARIVIRLGCKATVVNKDSESEMTAREVEKVHAKAEGVNFIHNLTPIRIVGNTKVEAVIFRNSKSNHEQIIPADTVIIAIGQEVDHKLFEEAGIALNGDKVLINQNYMASIEGIFCAGDCILGPATVIKAVDSARNAVDAICNFLLKK